MPDIAKTFLNMWEGIFFRAQFVLFRDDWIRFWETDQKKNYSRGSGKKCTLDFIGPT